MWKAINFFLWPYIMGVRRQIQKIQKGVAGTLNSSILDTFYCSETEFYKMIQKFKGKGVATASSAHP